MIQEGKIIKCLEGGMACVEVMRPSACAGNCSTCGGCVTMGEKVLQVEAASDVPVSPGDYVVLEGESRQVLSMAALVYMLPLVPFFGLYVAFMLMFESEGLALAGGGLGFLLAIVGVVLYSRTLKKRQKKPFRITVNLSQKQTNC